MEYINLLLILLPIILLSIASYENFYACKSEWQTIDNGCCPPNSSNNIYSLVNGSCCRNKITAAVFNKFNKKKDNKKINNYKNNKIKYSSTEFYCDNKPITA